MSRQRVYLLAVAVWLLLFVAAFSLGAVRELLVAPAIGEPLAHVVGTLTFVAVLLGITAVFVRRIRPRCSVTDLWLVGLLWLALTVAFERPCSSTTPPGSPGKSCWPTTTCCKGAFGCWCR